MHFNSFIFIAFSLPLISCGGSDGSTNTGGGGAAPPAPTNSNAQIASTCLTIVDQGQTLRAGVPVEGNHNFRITNNCAYAVNARLYSGGYVGTTVSTLASGASAVDDFFVTPGQPRGFACRAPLQPQVTLAGGLNRQCV